MKRFLTFFPVVFIIAFFITPVAAFAADSEYNEYLGSFDLSSFDTLDDSVNDFLEDLGVDGFDYEAISSVSASQVIEYVGSLVADNAKTPLKSGVTVICFIILTSFFRSMNSELNKSDMSGVFSTVSSLAISIFLFVGVTDCIALADSSIRLCADFAFAFFPAFCVIVAATGGGATSLSVNTLLLTLAQGLNYISEAAFVPLSNCFLALGICSGIREELNINSVVAALKKIITTLISTLSAVFVSILSLKTAVASRTDALGLRSMRFAINSVVPVIGSSISEGLLSIQSYSSLVKSSVGIVGIIAICAVFLPAIIDVAIWRLVLGISSVCADVFGDKSAVTTVRAFSDTLLIINVILILSMVTTVISLGILVAARTAG